MKRVAKPDLQRRLIAVLVACTVSLAGGAVHAAGRGHGGWGGGAGGAGGGAWHGGGGAPGGGWQGGGGGGNWHHHPGGWPGHGWVGGGYWWPYYGGWWPYGWGWGWPYAYGYGYPYAYGYAAYTVLPAPTADAEGPPRVASEWRYCPDTRMFYPHVADCASGWRTIATTPPGAAAPR